MILPQAMQQILAAKGSLIVDASKILPQTLQQLAATAAINDCHLTVTNCRALLPQTMIAVASAGRGCVTFDLR